MRKNIFKLLAVSMVLMITVGCTGKVSNSSDKGDNTKKPIEDKQEERAPIETGVDKEFARVDEEKPLEYYLVFCSWDKLSDENKGFFIAMHDNDEVKAREMYETYFMKFNLIHEVSHTVQGIYGVTGDNYFREQGANDMAIAYWREVDLDFVQEVEKVVDHMLSKLKSPIPEGADEGTYFVENYRELVSDPSKYGYYQFKFVKNALDSKMTLHEALVKNINSHIVAKNVEDTNDVKYERGDVAEIVNGYATYLYNGFEVDVPQLYLADQDTPSIQFVTRKKDK